ncbi:MAG: flagellar protein FlgN [Ancalomicrobiaceae bacterium]|nr:flagellar protein FlgN [Ancalomicrobiaceae bacterium]
MSLAEHESASAAASTTPMTPIERLLALSSQLADVVEEENRLLAMGFPSSLAATTEDKLRLARAIEQVMADPTVRLRTAAASEGERGLLAARIRRIQVAVAENSCRLAGALEATRRRIAAVMSAVKDRVSTEALAYGSNGRRPSVAATSAIRERLV